MCFVFACVCVYRLDGAEGKKLFIHLRCICVYLSVCENNMCIKAAAKGIWVNVFSDLVGF